MEQVSSHRGQIFPRVVVLVNQSSSSIDQLIENIGLEDSRDLLAKALPIIISRKHTLLKALEDNEITLASECAHQTSASIRLYGSSHLEELLQEVISLKLVQPVRHGLRGELETEFNDAINEIKKRL